jgi:hypothetical protein
MSGVPAKQEPTGLHWQMQMIFDEGHEIHHKWQKRIWDLGRLWGTFYCEKCHYAWPATAPSECEKCHASREFLRYHEIPLFDHKLHLAGHADGGVEDSLVEIKSIGLGTLRFEAPQLLKEHTYKLNINGKNREFIDYDGLWDSIRRPFPSHIRQGDFYCYLSHKCLEVIFLYECKWNQKVKEMIVRYRVERIQDRLDQCSRVTMALQGGMIPKCPFGGCTDCQRYEEKHAANGRVLVRRSTPDSQAAPQSARSGAENGERPATRRLSRFSD